MGVLWGISKRILKFQADIFAKTKVQKGSFFPIPFSNSANTDILWHGGLWFSHAFSALAKIGRKSAFPITLPGPKMQTVGAKSTQAKNL